MFIQLFVSQLVFFIDSLGLTLDDEDNNCDDEGFVMSPHIHPLDSKNDNLWKFSHCSESELEDFAESSSR